MSKTKRKWIVLDYNEDGSLRAEDIPYNASISTKTRLDDITLWTRAGIVLSPATAGDTISTSGVLSITGTAASRINTHNFGATAIEINGAGTGDRSAVVDFHADDTNTDYSFRAIRSAGVNGAFRFIQLGSGDVRFENDAGGKYIFNQTRTDTDFQIYKATSGNAFAFDYGLNTLTFGVPTSSADTSASVSTVTGCHTFGGGIGVAGDQYLGGKLSIAGGTFGTATKLSVNPHGTIDNITAVQISTGGAANHALVLQGVASQTGNILEIQDSTGYDLWIVGPKGGVTISPTQYTTGVPIIGFQLNVANHTNITALTDYQSFHLNGAVTQNFLGSGTTKANQRFALISAPTYTHNTTSQIITNAATLAISGAPIAGGAGTGGATTTITNPYALWIQGGRSRFAGSIDVADVSYTWPTSQGASNSVFHNDGTGVLSWLASVEQWTSTPPSSPTDIGIKGQMNYDGTSLHFCYNPDLWLSLNATLSPLFTATGAANRVAIWTGANTLTTDTNLTWNASTFGIASSTASVSTVTGACTVAGGIGIGGDEYLGGRLSVSGGVLGTASKFSVNTHVTLDNEAAAQISAGSITGHALVLTAYSSSQTANIFEVSRSTNANVFIVGANGNIAISPVALAGATPVTSFILNSANHTNITTATEFSVFNVNGGTHQFAAGLKTSQRFAVINAPTYTAVSATTTTNAATLAISGAPIASTNMTITNPYALWVQGGKSRFAGSIDIADVSYAWPTSQGVASSILQNDGSGNLSWTATTEQVVAVPANQSSIGIAGQVAYDANYKYECKAPNTWIQIVAISTFTT